MDIDDKFLDVDFTQDPNFVFGDLGVRAFDDRCRDYGDVQKILTDDEIDDAIEAMDAAGGGAERLVTRIYNQKSEGSCVANACSQANEVKQALQFGKDRVVPLSAISLYKRIGRSPSSGAMVSDGLEEMAENGILPLDTPENRARFGDCVMPNTGFRTPYPDDWQAVAKKFAGAEWTVVRSVNALLTALCNQHPVVVGRQGHSICYLRPMRKSGRRVVMYANSWGDWGSAGGDFDKGFGFDSESQIRMSAGWAFALRSVTIPK
jgi:hypothetical protein